MLKDLTDLVKDDTGYHYSLNGVITYASNPYMLLYTYYLGQFLFEAMHGDETVMKNFIIQQYNTYKSYASPTTVETSFVSDYEYFIT